ncbi:hypothetical protein RF11_00140 [Thelohanellus kitauei]|uniref:Uncharacterized protein n=1 Tax=Thelohanellus kitauei TaxID=669202 RepID=A0A0C2JLV4_THEKT|nr:hypothetical protein RF11_00140 [Thelohanellus kitauei]
MISRKTAKCASRIAAKSLNGSQKCKSNLDDILTQGVPILIPRDSVKKPYKIYVDSIESNSIRKAEYVTKTIARKNKDTLPDQQGYETLVDSLRLIEKNREIKKNLSKRILFDIIPPLMKQDYRISVEQKFVTNFYREKRFFYLKYMPDFVVSSASSKLHFDEKPVMNRSFNLFEDMKAFKTGIQPSKLVDSAGFRLEERKPVKRNRYMEYVGPAPSLAHPHLILVHSQLREKDIHGNTYSPVSHGIKVAFGALTSYVAEINRSLDRGTGWGYVFGQNLVDPLCCNVVVLSKEYYITLKYQLNSLQLFTNSGVWNIAEYSPKKYYHNGSDVNLKSAKYLISFLHEVLK